MVFVITSEMLLIHRVVFGVVRFGIKWIKVATLWIKVVKNGFICKFLLRKLNRFRSLSV